MPGRSRTLGGRAAARFAILKGERAAALTAAHNAGLAFAALEEWQATGCTVEAAQAWAASLDCGEVHLEWHDTREIEVEGLYAEGGILPPRFWARFGEPAATRTLSWTQTASYQRVTQRVDMCYAPIAVVVDDHVVLHVPQP